MFLSLLRDARVHLSRRVPPIAAKAKGGDGVGGVELHSFGSVRLERAGRKLYLGDALLTGTPPPAILLQSLQRK